MLFSWSCYGYVIEDYIRVRGSTPVLNDYSVEECYFRKEEGIKRSGKESVKQWDRVPQMCGEQLCSGCTRSKWGKLNISGESSVCTDGQCGCISKWHCLGLEFR